MATNWFRGTFEKDGKKEIKEVTSTTKSSTALRTELINQMKSRGYKFIAGSMGPRA